MEALPNAKRFYAATALVFVIAVSGALVTRLSGHELAGLLTYFGLIFITLHLRRYK